MCCVPIKLCQHFLWYAGAVRLAEVMDINTGNYAYAFDLREGKVWEELIDDYVITFGLVFLEPKYLTSFMLTVVSSCKLKWLSSPSIKHNFCSHFISSHPAPFHPPSPFPWHLHSSTPFHYLTSCDYDLLDKGFGLFTLSKVHKRSPSFSCQLDWLIVLAPVLAAWWVSWCLKLLTLTNAYPLLMQH